MVDAQDIFKIWKSECLELNAERFKANKGRELLKELVCRWRNAHGELEGLLPMRDRIIEVLSIRSEKPELRAKYKGWSDRLKKDLLTEIENYSKIGSSPRYGGYLLTHSMFQPYCPLKMEWVRQKCGAIAKASLVQRKKRFLGFHETQPPPVSAEEIERDLLHSFVSVHQFGSAINEEFDNFLFSDDYAETKEQWLIDFKAELHSEEEPYWYQVCREHFPQLFRVQERHKREREAAQDLGEVDDESY